MILFSIFHTTSQDIAKSDLFADIVSLLVIVFVAVALVMFRKSYGAQQITRGILPGIIMLFMAACLKTINDIYRLPWIIRYVLTDAFIAIAGIYVGITFIVLIKKLYASSNIDQLTGCFNKECFQGFLRLELARSNRKKQKLSLLYIDVDNFKAVNDRMGHAVGDIFLRELAQTIQKSVRASDVVVRWGGDEFAVVLPDSNQAQARDIIARITGSVDTKFQDFYGATISISIGMAIFPDEAGTPDELIRVADEQMYKIKTSKKAK
ncbi:MAG TPA: GGDEF domain-containing protein [Spirochaetia bacterium]|nr:GGDEF domain-containing protein [Spirochaetia bacterium]